MRLKEHDADREGKKVILSSDEIRQFIDQASQPPEIAGFLLGARCGLRRQEVVDVKARDIRDTDVGVIVRVEEGKGDKYREVPAPRRLQHTVSAMTPDPDDRVVDADPSTYYRWVKRAGERLAVKTGDHGWEELGPHDLRRSWAMNLLEHQVVPSLVMQWGGWDDFQTFRDHYLSEFSPEAVRRERQRVDYLADPSFDEEPRQGYQYIG